MARRRHSDLALGRRTAGHPALLEQDDEHRRPTHRRRHALANAAFDLRRGDRYGRRVDPFGHHGSVAVHLRDTTPEEMRRAVAPMAIGEMKCG